MQETVTHLASDILTGNERETWKVRGIGWVSGDRREALGSLLATWHLPGVTRASGCCCLIHSHGFRYHPYQQPLIYFPEWISSLDSTPVYPTATMISHLSIWWDLNFLPFLGSCPSQTASESIRHGRAGLMFSAPWILSITQPIALHVAGTQDVFVEWRM